MLLHLGTGLLRGAVDSVKVLRFRGSGRFELLGSAQYQILSYTALLVRLIRQWVLRDTITISKLTPLKDKSKNHKFLGSKSCLCVTNMEIMTDSTIISNLTKDIK